MSKVHYYDSIISPIFTEKATSSSENDKIIFKVHNDANKKIIKKNIEKIFKVEVIKINTINLKSEIKVVRGKKIKITGYKKAIITLKKGQSIDLSAGI